MFICIAEHRGGAHPGKVRLSFGACNFPYGGQELKKTSYQVVVGQGGWTWANFPGEVPNNAVFAGWEANGTAIAICRAAHNGGIHPGKIRAGFAGCNIPYGGREITIPQYEVLVF